MNLVILLSVYMTKSNTKCTIEKIKGRITRYVSSIKFVVLVRKKNILIFKLMLNSET